MRSHPTTRPTSGRPRWRCTSCCRARNCRQCGQPTCWNFALKLVAAQVELAACPPLGEPTYAERLAALEALLVPMPAIGLRDEGRVSG